MSSMYVFFFLPERKVLMGVVVNVSLHALMFSVHPLLSIKKRDENSTWLKGFVAA